MRKFLATALPPSKRKKKAYFFNIGGFVPLVESEYQVCWCFVFALLCRHTSLLTQTFLLFRLEKPDRHHRYIVPPFTKTSIELS
jgi:hypothetical protein